MSAFRMSKKDSELLDQIKANISCDVDKKTEVITIKVEDQDPLICATMADSVRNHLQTFITKYRTNKARVDVEHYEKLAKQSKREYEYCVREYSAYCDANQDVMLQSFISKRDELENEMQLKFNAYSAMRTQLEAMRAKLQEKTPAFTTIESATVPVKPAGPKRIIFIFGMCFLATFVTALWLARKQLFTKA
jgi:capsule polysaccharide export protein KpsE/RkpR